MNVTWWQEQVLGYRLHYRQESGYRFDMDAGYRGLRLIHWIHHILGAVACNPCNPNRKKKCSSCKVKESLVQGSGDLLNEHAKKMFKKFRAEGENQAGTTAPFTLQQIARVHKLVYEKFLHLKLSEALANRLADAVVATLIGETF